MFVDDRVFLISAAIEAYKEAKTNNNFQFSANSQWKIAGRKKQLRQ